MSSVCTLCKKKKGSERKRENPVLFFVQERDASLGLWIFSGGSCVSSRGSPAEGKQMRRNVNTRLLTQHCAKKKMCAPAARTGGSEEPAASSFSTADRGQNDPARPHPLPVHVTAPPSLSLQTQRGPAAHAFSVLLQVDREAFECLSDVIYRESGCARRLSAGASGAAAALGSPALPVITWIVKGVSAGLHRLYSDSQGCEINNRKASY